MVLVDVLHAEPFCDAARGGVLRMDDRDELPGVETISSEVTTRRGCLDGQAPSLECCADVIADLQSA